MAMELLTGPSLLVLDEPTAGLDAAAEREMTATLRRLADEGRVVVVATTSPTDIDICDQVVLLTGTGTPAFAGPPAQIGAELGTTDWTEIIARVNTDPYGAHDAYLARQPETPPAAEPLRLRSSRLPWQRACRCGAKSSSLPVDRAGSWSVISGI